MLIVGAEVVDLDGNAPCDRSALTGGGPLELVGRTLAFFWDLNADGDYSDVQEQLGNAVTTDPDGAATASASVTVDTTPVNGLPRAGIRDGALQVQLPSDHGQYNGSPSLGRLELFAAPPEAGRTTVVSNPPGTSAGGSSELTITATLRDRFDNALGLDADPHDVKFSIKGNPRGAEFRNGTAQRDMTTGLYSAALSGASIKGTVTVAVSVDGQPGPTLDVVFTGLFPVGPCACRAPRAGHLPLPAFILFVAFALRVRPRHARSSAP